MTVEEAQAYGKFLADRYKNSPNIIWIIGGDIQGDVKPEVWHALARAIKANDPNHLMTFHPRGRTTSADYYNDAEWLDFNMFQSGHRRYGQRGDDKNYPIPENTEEDNWRYVERSLAKTPMKPVLDGEPSYEKYRKGYMIPMNLYGKISIADVMLIGRFSQALSDTLMGTTISCNSIVPEQEEHTVRTHPGMRLSTTPDLIK